MTATQRHPRALPFLFLTEMWERFGFYVVQGMLILYLTQAFGFSDDKSYTIQGVFTALAYIAPMVGGLLADRFLGFKTAIYWGGAFLISGYALLALPFTGLFYPALATIIIGNGLFKPNISSLLGTLYEPNDPRRDSGFTIFYVGINLGVLLAGFSSGAIKNHFGWHAGFALASLGLVIGLCVFTMGLKWGGIKKVSAPIIQKKFMTRPFLFIYLLAGIGFISIWLQNNLMGNWLLPIVGIILLFYVFRLAFKQEPQYRNRLILLNFLILSSLVFWMLFLQLFSSANLFIDRLVDKDLLGFNIPTTAFYALESVFVILLGPLLAWSWQALNQSAKNPSPFIKFTFATIFIGLGFVILGASTYFANASHMISPWWIVLAYLAITMGEMLLSPIGLSAVTILSPPHLTGMMMGIWFVVIGFGGEFSGFLAKLSSVPEHITDSALILPIYRTAFFEYAMLAFGVAAALFVLQFFLRKMLED
jgi:POT family proton-dependent oligopeptide transporter